jgi:hypothetical protein
LNASLGIRKSRNTSLTWIFICFFGFWICQFLACCWCIYVSLDVIVCRRSHFGIGGELVEHFLPWLLVWHLLQTYLQKLDAFFAHGSFQWIGTHTKNLTFLQTAP